MEKVIKKYVPMTETAYYILLSLTEPRHGYGIIKRVEEITENRIKLGSGTIYGTLTKMQNDQMIAVFSDEKRKTIYEITEVGKAVMRAEIERIKQLYASANQFEEEFQ